MRNVFAEELYKLAIKNKNIYIVVADISPAGNMIQFQKKYPNRFINVGVSEQTMIGLSAGLALKKKKVFAYTIATFALYRPFEMVRNDICYQNLPVTVVGMGAGTIYNNLGATHQSQEDISIARSIPNMSIIAPSDPEELKEAVKYCCMKSKSPIYLRIGKSGEKNYSKNLKEKWNFGKIRELQKGRKICFLSYGPIMKKAFNVAHLIEKNYKIVPSIYSCHTLKPFDKVRIKKIFNKYDLIVTIEDHSIIGGLSNIVSSLAFENNYKGKLILNSLKDKFIHNYGTQDDHLNEHGISEKIILKKINKILKK